MFSETSRLYAQNYSVIEAVRSEFQREVNAFLDNVNVEIQSATSARSRQRITQTYRYWWIGGADKDRHPQVWILSSAPEIVHPGEITLNAAAPTASADQLHPLVAIANRPEFAAISRPWGGGTWSLFKIVVAYEGENPVKRVSRVAANLLLALNDVVESTTASGPAPGT